MNLRVTLLIVAAAVAAAQPTSAQEAVENLIYPDPSLKYLLVEGTGSTEGLLTGEVLQGDSPLKPLIETELNFPFHASLLKLNQCARNFRGDRDGFNVLYLSQNEGGFPRQGLVLTDGEGSRSYPGLFYVDLVLDERRVQSGELDIFSHELGHVMMLNIWQNIPDQRSTKQHVSMGVTDTTTAVFEGWGIHFQRLAFDAVPRYAETYKAAYDYSRNAGRLWHSSVDQQLRIHGVLQNEFVHRKLLPDVDLTALNPEELVMLEHTSPIFDRTKLRNAQQMLSCEGVLASLFYRMNTNIVLQARYGSKEFYEHFLLAPLPENLSPQDIFTPFENVILKHFWIWSRLNERLEPDSLESLPLEYIKEWSESFPEDREELYRLFILTTLGKSANNELARSYESMSYKGMIGDYQGFRALRTEFEELSRSLIAQVLAGELALDANVGPQLWIVNHDFQVRRALWTPQNTRPLAVNLNSASAFELASFPGMDLDRAEDLVREREERGFFKSFEDAESRGFKQR